MNKTNEKPCSKNPTITWLSQRISAIALIPIIFWLIILILEIVSAQNIEQIESVFISPFSTMLLALFLVIAIYHGYLGIKEIVEDYIHCPYKKLIFIILIRFICVISAIAGICSIIVLHLSTFAFN